MTIRRKKLGLGDAKSPTAGGSRSGSKLVCKHPRLEHSTTRKFLPMYIQGGTCSTLCDVSGAHADFGRHASAEKGFLGNSDAQAVGRFLKRNVVDTFSVRRVYDKVLYNRRADICAGNEPSENACILIWRLPRQRTVYCELTSRNTVLKEISTSEASVSVNDHRGVSVDRREERKRRRKASAVSGSLIILLE